MEEGTREWQDTKRGYALARHMSQNNPAVIKYINQQETDEEERREEMKEEIGMMTERGWKKIENIKTKEIYERLKKKRYGEMKKEEMRVNHATTTIRKKLTPKERQFWLRCAYQTIQPNKRKSKWLKQRNGEVWTDKFPTCKKEVETWSHMEYECEKLESYMYEVRWVYDEYVIRNEIKNAQEWTTPTIDEWRLETGTEMTTERMLVIAKARWVFHCERARCDHKQRRTLKIDRHDRQIERRNENDEKTSEQKNRQQQEAAETTESRKESSRSSESSRITTEQKQKQKQNKTKEKKNKKNIVR